MQHFYRMGLGYLNRGAPNDTMIISGKNIVSLHHSFMELKDGAMIPYHRILKIFYDGKLVWERK